MSPQLTRQQERDLAAFCDRTPPPIFFVPPDDTERAAEIVERDRYSNLLKSLNQLQNGTTCPLQDYLREYFHNQEIAIGEQIRVSQHWTFLLDGVEHIVNRNEDGDETWRTFLSVELPKVVLHPELHAQVPWGEDIDWRLQCVTFQFKAHQLIETVFSIENDCITLLTTRVLAIESV